MNNSKAITWLRKYILIIPLGIGLLALLILYFYVRATMQASSTPIPRIELEANLENKEPPEKTQLYEEQKREEQRARYHKQEMPADRLVALDFSRQYLMDKEPDNEAKEDTDTVAMDKPKKKVVRKRKPNSGIAAERILQEEEEIRFNTIKAEVPEAKDERSETHSFFQAVIDGDQKIRGNTLLKMRLAEPAVINGKAFPPGTRFNGRASLGRQKITVHISRILSSRVDMQVYDYDYSEGIVLNDAKSALDGAIEESTEDGLDDALRDIPYGGIARFGKQVLKRKSSRNKEVILNDGYPIFISQQ